MGFDCFAQSANQIHVQPLQPGSLDSSRFVGDSNAKTAMRLRGYLIRLTREYTDGGMDSRAG